MIELDGGQHFTPEMKSKDGVRDEYMHKMGLNVLRISDRKVFKNTEGVMGEIWKHL